MPTTLEDVRIRSDIQEFATALAPIRAAELANNLQDAWKIAKVRGYLGVRSAQWPTAMNA